MYASNMITRIYGSSDDLIEIDGEITDEANCNVTEKIGISFSVSDGTSGTITYDGEWKISLLSKGDKFVKVVKTVGDDKKHIESDAEDCTPYSDVLILSSGIDWVKIGRKRFKA